VNQLPRGFTLIEIIIVILIISIVGTIAMISIGHNDKKDIEVLGKQMFNLLSLASEEALLRPATLGLAFTPTTFQFYVHQEKNPNLPAWSPITQPPLNLHTFSKDIKITIKVHGKEMPLNGQPQIIITQSGDITPFILLLGSQNKAPSYKVTELASRPIREE